MDLKEKRALGNKLEKKLNALKAPPTGEQSFRDWVMEQIGKTPSSFLTKAQQKSLSSKYKKKKVSGSDIRVPRKGRPVTPEAAEAASKRLDEGIRVKRDYHDIDGGIRLTGWKEAAEAERINRIASGEYEDRGYEFKKAVDKRPWERRFEFPGRAEEAAAIEKQIRERRKRISKQNKGGLPKKPKFMKGGSYKGKPHMYAAGGMVKELKI